jgi:hypothetical protein
VKAAVAASVMAVSVINHVSGDDISDEFGDNISDEYVRDSYVSDDYQ